ncbi:hypothetical protein T09_3994 [Trichinella sp. T9]|nr:hypothetical protein T09_3994 [Trichinella sp. T9]
MKIHLKYIIKQPALTSILRIVNTVIKYYLNNKSSEEEYFQEKILFPEKTENVEKNMHMIVLNNKSMIQFAEKCAVTLRNMFL